MHIYTFLYGSQLSWIEWKTFFILLPFYFGRTFALGYLSRLCIPSQQHIHASPPLSHLSIAGSHRSRSSLHFKYTKTEPKKNSQPKKHAAPPASLHPHQTRIVHRLTVSLRRATTRSHLQIAPSRNFRSTSNPLCASCHPEPLSPSTTKMQPLRYWFRSTEVRRGSQPIRSPLSPFRILILVEAKG